MVTVKSALVGSVAVLFALPGCTTADVASSEPMDPLVFCESTAPLWDADAIPNFDDEMSGAERATATASFSAAIDTLPQGVELGVMTQEQADLLAKGLRIFQALYEDPSLVDQGASAAAEVAGLTPEEFESINEPGNPVIEGAVQGLTEYCVSAN